MALARPTRGPNACGTVGKRAARNEWQETRSRGGRILAPLTAGDSRRVPTHRGDRPTPVHGVVNRRGQRRETPPFPDGMGGWDGTPQRGARSPRTPTPPRAAHRPGPVPAEHAHKSATHQTHRCVASRGQTDGIGGRCRRCGRGWLAASAHPRAGPRVPASGGLVGRRQRLASGCRPPGHTGEGEVRPPPRRRQVSNVRSGDHRRPSR